MKASEQWSARDNGFVAEIKKHLDKVGKDYNLDFTLEISWLDKLEERFHTYKFKVGDVLKRKDKDYTFQVDDISGGFYICNQNHGAHFYLDEENKWEIVEKDESK